MQVIIPYYDSTTVARISEITVFDAAISDDGEIGFGKMSKLGKRHVIIGNYFRVFLTD